MTADRESFVDAEDKPGRERFFVALFAIADKYDINVTNNTPDPASGLRHIGDFCSDVLGAAEDSGWKLYPLAESSEEVRALTHGAVAMDAAGRLVRLSKDAVNHWHLLDEAHDTLSLSDNELVLPLTVLRDGRNDPASNA